MITKMSREAVLSLMERKKELEAQIEQQGLILSANRIGMHEPLVDGEGYPLSNVDVLSVRKARHTIICLQNDRKKIMQQIEKGIAQVFEAEQSAPANGQQQQQHHHQNLPNEPMEVDGDRTASSAPEPFAVVESVVPGQLADRMGIAVGDQIVQVGTVTARNFKTMNQVQSVIANMQGRKLHLVVRKATSGQVATIELDLTSGSRLGIFMKPR
uniref:26S proteasome non-ATPase regulatory subunit 9 n=1 Tax=Anopheles quadriannulatus TaxID=34691 RepID=A0A182X814_ANOQN